MGTGFPKYYILLLHKANPTIFGPCKSKREKPLHHDAIWKKL
jgi:hypothetical protein